MYELQLLAKKIDADDFRLVSFKGEIDNTCVNEVQKKLDKVLEDFPEQYLIFDLRYLQYVNSQFVGYILSVYSLLNEQKKHLVLAQAQPQVHDVFNNLGVFELVKYEESVEQYIAKII